MKMKIHSDAAWNIASCFSHILASDTRTLATQIDVEIAKTRADEREACAVFCEEYNMSVNIRGEQIYTPLKHHIEGLGTHPGMGYAEALRNRDNLTLPFKDRE